MRTGKLQDPLLLLLETLLDTVIDTGKSSWLEGERKRGEENQKGKSPEVYQL